MDAGMCYMPNSYASHGFYYGSKETCFDAHFGFNFCQFFGSCSWCLCLVSVCCLHLFFIMYRALIDRVTLFFRLRWYQQWLEPWLCESWWSGDAPGMFCDWLRFQLVNSQWDCINFVCLMFKSNYSNQIYEKLRVEVLSRHVYDAFDASSSKPCRKICPALRLLLPLLSAAVTYNRDFATVECLELLLPRVAIEEILLLLLALLIQQLLENHSTLQHGLTSSLLFKRYSRRIATKAFLSAEKKSLLVSVFI